MFDQLGFNPDLLAGVRDRGFVRTTPVQTAVLPLVRAGGDFIACAETGTGKTAAFVLPLVDRLLRRWRPTLGRASLAGRTRVLVLTPTRELAVQIDDDVQGFGYHAGVSSMAVYGGAPMEPQSRALTAGIPVVVATPGRLMDHMRSGTAVFDGLETLVLDEADRMLDMGFWPDVRRIVDALPARAPDAAVLGDDAGRDSRLRARTSCATRRSCRSAAATPRRARSRHAVENVADRREDRLAGHVPAAANPGPILVFVPHQARRRPARVGSSPRAASAPTALHADRSQRDRLSAVEGFKSGRIRVLVATDIAARGLDIDGITHVVNYDVPHTPEAYVHRVGRTGRALATGTAVTLVSPARSARCGRLRRACRSAPRLPPSLPPPETRSHGHKLVEDRRLEDRRRVVGYRLPAAGYGPVSRLFVKRLVRGEIGRAGLQPRRRGPQTEDRRLKTEDLRARLTTDRDRAR